MTFLGYAYRFFSNFALLALVYFSLNFMEKYQQRTIVAILVLVYCAMRAVSALRSFNFFQKIERLEFEARRLAGIIEQAAGAAVSRKQIVNDVAVLRRDGEVKSYIDLLFIAMVVVLCAVKIVTD
jgi:ABC-type transport system involved in cytochrome bd biosynthesis fused ATPase/permease subunit